MQKNSATHVIEHGLHQRNSDFGLLHEVILRVLDLQPGSLLSRWARGLQPMNNSSARPSSRREQRAHLHLLRGVELEPAPTDCLAGLHRDGDARREGGLPGLQELRADRVVLLHPRVGDLLPCARVRAEGGAELVLAADGARLESLRGGRRGAADRVREGLVLGGGRRRGRGRGRGPALEVLGGEVGEPLADGRAELGDGLLDLRRVVVRLALVYFRYSVWGRSCGGRRARARGDVLQERVVDLAEVVDPRLEVLVLCGCVARSASRVCLWQGDHLAVVR